MFVVHLHGTDARQVNNKHIIHLAFSRAAHSSRMGLCSIDILLCFWKRSKPPEPCKKVRTALASYGEEISMQC